VRFRRLWRNQTYCGLVILAIAVFALAFAIPESQQPSEDQAASHARAEKELPTAGWIGRMVGKTFDDPIAFFTLVLAISTLGLWRVTQNGLSAQSRDTRRSLRIADRQARTAERALIELERPWVFLQGATIRRRDLHGTGITPNYFWVKLRWKNIGRAPALIEECLFQFVYKDQLPPEPLYRKEAGFSCPRSVTVDGEIDTNEIGPPSGENRIYVLYGRLAYKELNGTIRHTGYAIEISPHIAAFSPYGGDNEGKYVYYT
jgi:hypothetical protein